MHLNREIINVTHKHIHIKFKFQGEIKIYESNSKQHNRI